MKYIFVHGLGDSSFSWKETIEAMNRNLEIEYPNLFELCDGEVNYNNLYRNFDKYCNNYPSPLNICGLSLGGVLSLNYAIHNPDRVESLVLIGTQYRIPKNVMRLQNIVFKVIPNKTFTKIGLSKKKVLTLSKSMMDINFEEELHKIKCRVLIICGEKDKANIGAAIKLSKILHNSELKIIPKVGHQVSKESPEILAKILNDFFEAGN